MWYEVNAFHCPRCVEHPGDYEDAYAASLDGFAAISDGVASAIFSSIWSRLLVESAVESRPDFSDAENFAAWLSVQRQLWLAKIDMDALGYFQKMKLQRTGGAFATLLTLDFRFEGEDDDSIGRYDSRVYGDCCLFHERNGELLTKFPMSESQEFKGAPDSLGSTDQGTDDQLEFSSMNGTFEVGDRFFMTTDAVGEWIYKEIENEQLIDWDAFASMDRNSWREFIVQSRNRPEGLRMTVDDSTMMVVSILLKPSQDVEIEESPDNSVMISSGDVVDDMDLPVVNDDEISSNEELDDSQQPVEKPVPIGESSEVLDEDVDLETDDSTDDEADRVSSRATSDLIFDVTQDDGGNEFTSFADLTLEDAEKGDSMQISAERSDDNSESGHDDD